MKNESDINGILLVNKQGGFTSRDVVNKISHIFGTKKVGHTGTLDPIAEGVLVITIGKYTKLCDHLTSKYKEYIAELELGYETDTLDITGSILKESTTKVSQDDIRDVILSFKGKYNQEVPIYSAVKIDGKKLYEYAREGKMVDLPKREVEIQSIEILSIDGNTIRIKTTVSKGTYIRSLIRDIGVKLGTYATMKSLVRTKQGKFSIEETSTLEEIESGKYKLLELINVLDNLKVVELDRNIEKRIFNGVSIQDNLEYDYILYRKDNTNIALYKKDKDMFKMFIKF